MNDYKILQTDAELLAAALFQMHVTAWLLADGDKPVYNGEGKIEKITPYSCKMNGVYYLRMTTEFRVYRQGTVKKQRLV